MTKSYLEWKQMSNNNSKMITFRLTKRTFKAGERCKRTNYKIKSKQLKKNNEASKSHFCDS